MKKIILILSAIVIGPLAFAADPHFLPQTIVCTGYTSSSCSFQDPYFSISSDSSVMPDTYTFAWANVKANTGIQYFYSGSMVNIHLSTQTATIQPDTQYPGNAWQLNGSNYLCYKVASTGCPYENDSTLSGFKK